MLLVKNETAGKLDNKYEGPYTVVEDLGVNVKIYKNNCIDIIRKNRTKLFVQ